MTVAAAKARRFVVRDMGVFPDFVDGRATDGSFPVLLKLLKRKLSRLSKRCEAVPHR
ncbi:MAG: hypothetical protein QOF66_6795 [Mycobacterium sp.]|nr:hypothetical protein [Mycobacterium sp.]